MRPSYRCGVLPRLVPSSALLAAALLGPSPAEAQPSVPAVELIRAVARAQRRADLAVTASSFDQVEVRTDFGRDGRPKSVKRRRYAYFTGDDPREATRELVEVDGRPPTESERREDAEEDGKRRRERVERETRARASRPPGVSGEEDDPLVGARRLSDLIDRFSYGPVEELLVEGRPAYGLRFSPRPGLRASTLGDRALNALVGRVVVDASDLQVVSVEARLVSPVKVGGGLAASIREAGITYRAQRLGDGAWLPCLAELRVRGRTALFFRLDSAFRFEFSGFARYSVEVETDVGRPSVQSAP